MARMSDLRFIRSKHPKAEALFSQYFKWWGVFLTGHPRIVGGPKGDWETPFTTGITKAEALANARKLLEAE